MKKVYSKYFFVCCSLLFCTHNLQSQQVLFPKIEVESKYLGEHKVVVGETRSYPPHLLTKSDGYNFEIKIHMEFLNTTNFIGTIYRIVYSTSDGTLRKINIDPENIIKISAKNYDYVFKLNVEREGWIQVFIILSTSNDLSKNISNKENVFLSPF